MRERDKRCGKKTKLALKEDQKLEDGNRGGREDVQHNDGDNFLPFLLMENPQFSQEFVFLCRVVLGLLVEKGSHGRPMAPGASTGSARCPVGFSGSSGRSRALFHSLVPGGGGERARSSLRREREPRFFFPSFPRTRVLCFPAFLPSSLLPSVCLWLPLLRSLALRDTEICFLLFSPRPTPPQQAAAGECVRTARSGGNAQTNKPQSQRARLRAFVARHGGFPPRARDHENARTLPLI